MHWLGYNDAVSWLNKAKTRIFQPTANFEILYYGWDLVKITKQKVQEIIITRILNYCGL